MHSTELFNLPFVTRARGRAPRFWATPPATNYAEACATGRVWAALYVDFVRRTGHTAALTTIVGQMDHQARGPASGYRVGFLAQLEDLAVEGATHVGAAAHAASANLRAQAIECARREHA